MSITSLIPRKRSENKLSVQREGDPFYSLQSQINSLFEDFWRDPFSLSPPEGFERISGFTPHIDISETDKELQIEAELPGLDENDIQLSLSNNVLTITGKKERETEDKGRDYYRAERSYGSFHRELVLTDEVDQDKIEAVFKKGVLTITAPKLPEAVSTTKRIKVKAA